MVFKNRHRNQVFHGGFLKAIFEINKNQILLFLHTFKLSLSLTLFSDLYLLCPFSLHPHRHQIPCLVPLLITIII